MGDSRPKNKPLKKAQIVDFYDHASSDLHRMLARKLGSQEEAKEIAHDAFEKLLHLAERQDIKDLRRFFFTMANRMALDVLRRREVQNRFLRSQPVGNDNDRGQLSEDDPERILLGRERLKKVQQVLADLPVKTRHIFLLHRFESHTYAEISRQMGLSRKSVEYHMNRALIAISKVTELSDER